MAVLGGTDAIQETLSKSHDRDIIAKRGSFLEPDPIHSDMCVSGAGGTAQQEKHLTHQHKDVRLLPRAHVFRTEHSGDCVQSPPGHGETARQVLGARWQGSQPSWWSNTSGRACFSKVVVPEEWPLRLFSGHHTHTRGCAHMSLYREHAWAHITHKVSQICLPVAGVDRWSRPELRTHTFLRLLFRTE